MPFVESDGGNDSRREGIAYSDCFITRNAAAFINFCCLKAGKAVNLWTWINRKDYFSHLARPRTRQPASSVRVTVPLQPPTCPQA